METIPNWILGLLIGVASVGLAAIGLLVSTVRGADNRGRETGAIITKIDNVEKKVDGLITAQSAQTSTCRSHGERVAVVVQSAKSAHHRLDALEAVVRGRQNGGNE